VSDRYARQSILPEVGAEGQARLGAATVVVVGAGGLGCAVLQYLTAAGVGRLMIVDHDRVEESNLHRQPLYRMTDLGRRARRFWRPIPKYASTRSRNVSQPPMPRAWWRWRMSSSTPPTASR
jgi:molybdopterin/thiamine biosynthesis adenylyltransferase